MGVSEHVVALEEFTPGRDLDGQLLRVPRAPALLTEDDLREHEKQNSEEQKVAAEQEDGLPSGKRAAGRAYRCGVFHRCIRL